MTAVLGAKGNMGRRYCAILRHLGKTPVEIDIPHSVGVLKGVLECVDEVIIATPTKTHINVLHEVLDNLHHPISILCEKPIAKTIEAVETGFTRAKALGCQLYTVNQYAFVPEAFLFRAMENEPTTYDYYRTGDDGLHFDCFQLYGLARYTVQVRDKSPIWKCYINGVVLNIKHMDAAYVDMVKNFLTSKDRLWGKEITLATTERILKAL